MKGQTISPDSKNRYNYKKSDGNIWQTSDSTEGIETVGIIGNSKYTDNKLRKEQGLNEKIKY